MKRIILTAAAVGAVLAGSVAAAAPALASNGPGQSISAYYWNANGHALTGPQSQPADFSNPAGLALATENAHGQNIAGQTITITGTVNVGALQNAYSGDSGAYARIWFDGAGGSSAQSPQGYLNQVWWNHATLDLNSATNGVVPFTVQATVNPTSDWSNWNGIGADVNSSQFNGAASHVQQIGLSFGGASFFEDGVTGTGSITIDTIHVTP